MKLVKRIAGVVLALAAGIYGADYFVAKTHPQGSVTVQPYYAVPQKSHKTEFIMLDPEVDSCVNSLFPHMGFPPCWYLTGHTQKRIDM